MNRNKALKAKNVIQLPYVPIPQKPIALIADQDWRSLDKKAKVIAKPKKQSLKKKNEPIELKEIVSIDIKPNDDTEESFIGFSDGLAMVRGFGNQWMVVLNDGLNGTESMTDWVNRNEAEAIIKDLLAA